MKIIKRLVLPLVLVTLVISATGCARFGHGGNHNSGHGGNHSSDHGGKSKTGHR